MKVLVLWADSRSANLGVRVLAEGMASFARRAFGEETLVDFQDYGPGDSAIGFGGRSIVRDVGRRRGPIAEKIQGYDLVLDSGAGDSFASIYGLKRLTIMRYAHRRTARLGIPLVFGPQTIGPFEDSVSRTMARRSMADARAVIARDPISLAAGERLGAHPVLATDVVFALAQPPVTTRRDVIVNVSGLLWNSDRHGSAVDYRDCVLRLVSALRTEERDVSLFAHVIDNPTVDNDVPAIAEAAGLLGGGVETIVPTDLEDARGILGSANIVIGSRMHACLNALSTGTPAIPWAYSRKFAPLMNDLGWTHTLEVRNDADLVSSTLRLIAKGFSEEDLVGVRSRAEARVELGIQALRRSLPMSVEGEAV